LGNLETVSVIGYSHATSKIPWSEVRNSIDGFFNKFPGKINIDHNADIFSKHLFSGTEPNKILDNILGINQGAPKLGNMHRWGNINTGLRGGHDLILDVGDTLIKKGPVKAAHQIAHIVLTDFPTKAGIPIPLLSINGIGKFLVTKLNIPIALLNIDLLETIVGGLSIAEGTNDLIAAFQGNLPWGVGTFFDTFVEGLIELKIGIVRRSSLLIIAGYENIAAGSKSLYDYLVEPNFFGVPIDFLSNAFIYGFLIGGSISYLCSTGKPIPRKIINTCQGGLKTGLLSSSFAMHPLAGLAMFSTLTMYNLAKILGKRHNQEISKLYWTDDNGHEHFLKELTNGPSGNEFSKIWDLFNDLKYIYVAQEKALFDSISDNSTLLKSNFCPLDSNTFKLLETEEYKLFQKPNSFKLLEAEGYKPFESKIFEPLGAGEYEPLVVKERWPLKAEEDMLL
jgi:hypothetical protein